MLQRVQEIFRRSELLKLGVRGGLCVMWCTTAAAPCRALVGGMVFFALGGNFSGTPASTSGALLHYSLQVLMGKLWILSSSWAVRLYTLCDMCGSFFFGHPGYSCKIIVVVS